MDTGADHHESSPALPGEDRASETGRPLPAGSLPGPHRHLELLRCLGRSPGREVFSAASDRWPDQLAIVELTQDTFPHAARGRGRFSLDLRPWAGEGWPAAALVTLLPTPLPGPYSRFELMSFIGLGGMGQVWMAESPDYPDLPLAIKFFTHPVYRQHPLLLEQCLQEARVGISIDSPHVVRTYQLLDLRSYQEEGWPGIGLVMPLYEPSLQRVLDDLRQAGRRLPLRLALALARDVAEGLQALHARHALVHRDVKPSNILLRLPEDQRYRGPDSLRQATALVSDLGTLCRVGERPVFALGQDGWKAPEVFDPPGGARPDGERAASPAEDWYAFGKVLEALAGHSEFAAGPEDRTVGRSRDLATLPPPDASAERLHHFADALTTPNPDSRMAAVGQMQDLLLGAVPPGPAASRPVIPGYEILEALGRGGMGEVFVARQQALNRVVALKIIHFAERDDRYLRRRFADEAQAMARLDHPNIVRIHDSGECDGFLFLAMEYCEGGTLASRIERSPPGPEESAALLEPLARAIQYAHDQGIVHRDLKPANVLLTRDGAPKIADFGLARILDASTRLTRTGVVLGTPAYMAPEQARGDQSRIGPATDVYGLGAVLYHLLAGRPPFADHTRHELLHRVVDCDPPPPRQVAPRTPRDLEAVCLKCLQKDPRRRYASASALAEDLRRFLEGAPIQARPPGPGTLFVRWCRRRPFVAAILAVLVVLTPGVAWVRLHRRQKVQQASQSTQAVRETEADLSRLEVERLAGFLAANEIPRLESALHDLRESTTAREDIPTLLIWQGELALADPGGPGARAIQQALNRPGRLSRAERAYGKALLETRPAEHLALLVEAVEADPFHQRAQRALALARLVRGDHESARERSRFLRIHFPADPVPDFLEALLAATRGDGSAVEKFSRLGRPGPERPALVALLRAVLDSSKPWEDWLVGRKPGLASPRDKALRVAELTGPAVKGLGCGAFPLLSLGKAQEAAAGLSGFEQSSPEKALARIARAREETPDALLLVMEIELRYLRALRRLRDRPDEFQRELRPVAELHRQTSSYPTLSPREPLLYQSRRFAVFADLFLLRTVPEPSAERAARLRENLDRLVVEGRPWPEDRERRLEAVVKLLLLDPRGKERDKWTGERLRSRQQLFASLGRRLLADWRQDEPASFRPCLLAAKLELWADNPLEAVRAARAAVRLARDDDDRRQARRIEREAFERLRDQGERLRNGLPGL
jgi:serine/threonine protein kinase